MIGRFNIRTALTAVVCSALMFFALSCEAPQPEAPQNTDSFVVRGRVDIPAWSGKAPEEMWITVSLEGNTVKSLHPGKDGSFRIAGLTQGSYDIVFSSSEPMANSGRSMTKETSTGIGGWLANITPVPDHALELGSVEMKPLGTIKGRVLRNGAAPDMNGDIDIYIPGSSFYARTDRDGNFSIFNVPQGRYAVRASAKGMIPHMTEDVLLWGSDPKTNPVAVMADVRLTGNTGSISGTAFLSGSKDSSGITVTAELGGEAGTRIFRTLENGAFSLRGLEPGEYALVLRKDGYIPFRVEGVTVTAGKDTPAEEIFLSKTAGTVKGTVELSGKSIHDGTIVSLQTADGEVTGLHATTDMLGNFVISGVEPGSYGLISTHSGFKSVSVGNINVASAGSYTVDRLSMEPAECSITGKVFLEGLTDMAGAKVTATSTENAGLVYPGITNGEGRYWIGGLGEGEYILEASAKGFVPIQIGSVSIVTGKVQEVSPVKLERARGAVVGRVVSAETGEPLEGAKVEMSGTGHSAVTDSEGLYMMELVAGNYPTTLIVTLDYYGTEILRENITVQDRGAFAFPDIEMDVAYCNVSGRIASSVPMEGLKVTLGGMEGFTGSDGRFLVKYVSVDTVSMEVEGLMTSRREIPVKLGAETEVDLGDIPVEPDSSAVRGRVILNGCTDHSGIRVEWHPWKSYRDYLVTETDADGDFLFPAVPEDIGGNLSFIYRDWKENSFGMNVGGVKVYTASPDNKGTPFVLTEEISPVLRSVSASLDNGEVVVTAEGYDGESGVEKYEWSGDPSFVTGALHGFSEAPHFRIQGYDGSVVYVRAVDHCGNVSAVHSASVGTDNGVVEVGGNAGLPGLSWSGYAVYEVVGNVEVPSGSVLTIGEGTEVLFTGPYSIKGDLRILGTEERPVVMKSSGKVPSTQGVLPYEGEWTGIVFQGNAPAYNSDGYVSGMIMKHCFIEDSSSGISGPAYVRNSYISSSGFAVGSVDAPFSGRIEDSEMRGSINIGAEMKSCRVGGNGSDSRFINSFTVISDTSITDIAVSGTGDPNIYGDFIGCEFSGIEIDSGRTLYTIIGSTIHSLRNPVRLSSIKQITGTNFPDESGVLVIDDLWDGADIGKWSNNWWGSANTVELEGLDEGMVPSFVSIDSTVADRNTTLLDWRGYRLTKMSLDVLDYDFKIRSNMMELTGEVVFSITGSEEAVSYRVAGSEKEIQSALWRDTVVDGSGFVLGRLIPQDGLDSCIDGEGRLRMYIEVKGKSGRHSNVLSLSIPVLPNRIVSFCIEEGEVFYRGESIELAARFLRDDDSIKWELDGAAYYETTLDMDRVMPGVHTLTAIADPYGWTGSTTECSRTFVFRDEWRPDSGKRDNAVFYVMNRLPVSVNEDLRITIASDDQEMHFLDLYVNGTVFSSPEFKGRTEVVVPYGKLTAETVIGLAINGGIPFMERVVNVK